MTLRNYFHLRSFFDQQSNLSKWDLFKEDVVGSWLELQLSRTGVYVRRSARLRVRVVRKANIELRFVMNTKLKHYFFFAILLPYIPELFIFNLFSKFFFIIYIKPNTYLQIWKPTLVILKEIIKWKENYRDVILRLYINI